ncbi:MAG: 16S rRNA (guanine(527)-N(7))-methyltransferase RsmG [Zoogloea sp.]|jgi:16S rRNA (guanine527-N7)-methyltransferase|nr:16S rRNA (guanine(527)-N(7))-methyltransferase RsmG [Zoogloea sp.]
MSMAATLAKGSAALGLDLPAEAQEKLLAFARLLIKWNKVYNLTAIRDEAQVVTHHLLDSLSVLPQLAGIKRLVDVGSGGGLPGVVLAICRPELQVDSVETVQKKATFQNQARIELKLANFRAHHARIENWQPAYFAEQPVDGIVSRAFADLADFVNLSAHLAGPETRILAMKGVYPADEIARIPAGFALERSTPLTVPGLDAERHLIIVKRSKN